MSLNACVLKKLKMIRNSLALCQDKAFFKAISKPCAGIKLEQFYKMGVFYFPYRIFLVI